MVLWVSRDWSNQFLSDKLHWDRHSYQRYSLRGDRCRSNWLTEYGKSRTTRFGVCPAVIVHAGTNFWNFKTIEAISRNTWADLGSNSIFSDPKSVVDRFYAEQHLVPPHYRPASSSRIDETTISASLGEHTVQEENNYSWHMHLYGLQARWEFHPQ